MIKKQIKIEFEYVYNQQKNEFTFQCSKCQHCLVKINIINKRFKVCQLCLGGCDLCSNFQDCLEKSRTLNILRF